MKKNSSSEPEAEGVKFKPTEADASAQAEMEKLIAEAAEELKPTEAEEPKENREEVIQKLQADCSALRDQLIRRQADFENFRKRTQREINELKQLAAAELTEALLPVLDGFERALGAQGGDSLEGFKKGFELIYKQFYDTLMRFGLTPVKAHGRPFDPHYHEAVDRVESEEYKDQTVIEELQRGYTFKHKLLRPAMVKVAVHPAPAAAGEESSEAREAEGESSGEEQDPK